ncbi:hypothetical protein DAQ1742_03891 [Dickeya aquatica]|uniref:Uncharacterized protein n=2 Tax=Dickeya TaxID=204037 RepID=A0A375AF01_9GAMM|nr:hypothetical protein DAQ1742_03891 [Dickeya aquatica]
MVVKARLLSDYRRKKPLNAEGSPEYNEQHALMNQTAMGLDYIAVLRHITGKCRKSE